jgi:hypothetical protein
MRPNSTSQYSKTTTTKGIHLIYKPTNKAHANYNRIGVLLKVNKLGTHDIVALPLPLTSQGSVCHVSGANLTKCPLWGPTPRHCPLDLVPFTPSTWSRSIHTIHLISFHTHDILRLSPPTELAVLPDYEGPELQAVQWKEQQPWRS